MSKIRVTQIRSEIGHPVTIKRTLWGLGLRGIHRTRELKDNNCIRGMINKVKHMVSYELLDK
jgi:large subunit ribosomal protein L30